MGTGDNIIPTQEAGPRRNQEGFSPVGDLYAPFFDVVFYSADTQEGEVVPKSEVSPTPGTTISGITEKSPLGAARIQISSKGGMTSYSPEGSDSPVGQLINYRSNLEVSMVSSMALQATLTLSPPYEAAMEIIDHQLIRFGSLMEVQWGYLSLDGGSPSVSDKGLFRITEPSIKFGKEVQVAIGGFDILSSALGTTDTRRRWSREDNKSDLDIIRKVVKERLGPGVDLNIDGLSQNSRLRKKKARAVVQASEDWVFFRRLLRHNNVEFFQKGTVVELRDAGDIFQSKPKYRLTWFMQPETDKDVPMITFEANPYISLYQGTSGLRGQRTVTTDADTGEVKGDDRDPSDTGSPRLGTNTNASDRAHSTDAVKTSEGTVAVHRELDKSNSQGSISSQPGRGPNQEEQRARENKEKSLFYGMHAAVVCPGVPGMVPQKIVEVVNVGNKFSDNYLVMKVTHNIGVGYTMKLDIINSAASADKAAGYTASRDKGNEKIIDAEAGADEEVAPALEDGA